MDRPAGLPNYVRPDVILDADHAVEFIIAEGETQVVGGWIWHRVAVNPDSAHSGWCCGTFLWRQPAKWHEAPIWTLHSLDPLDVSPSIKCTCGAHGFIRQGRWVPA